MIDRSEELSLLVRARAGLSPSEVDRVRVLRSLRSAVAQLTPAIESPGTTPAMWSRGLSSWPMKLLLAASIAGVSGTTGYWLGQRARSERGQAPKSAMPADVTSTGRARETMSTSGTDPVSSPRAAPPPPRQLKEQRTPVHAGSPGPRRETSHGARPEREWLARELGALRAIERALRDGKARLALALLQELDREVPGGKLREERQATSVIARCMLGDLPFGVDLAEDFATEHPGSVYLKRVAAVCAGKASAGEVEADRR